MSLMQLAQVVKPIGLSTGQPTLEPSDPTQWIALAAILGAAAVLGWAWWAVVRLRKHELEPHESAWRKLASLRKLRASHCRTLQAMSDATGVPESALILSRFAMERAMLRTVGLIPQKEMAQLSHKCWPDIEVPGAMGRLPAIAMPEIQPAPLMAQLTGSLELAKARSKSKAKLLTSRQTGAGQVDSKTPERRLRATG